MASFSLGNVFYWIGYKTAMHPIIMIIVPLIICAFILFGLIFIDFEVSTKI